MESSQTSYEYLKITKDYIFTYRKSDRLEIIENSDFDFTGCQDSKRSTLSYIYMLAKGNISWRNVKSTLIGPSTMAAQFIACHEISNHGIWLPNYYWIAVMDDIERLLKKYCDNKSIE